MPPPAGFKRSRIIWDETRRPHSNWREMSYAWCSAICYELQPIRLSESNKQQFIEALKQTVRTVLNLAQNAPKFGKTLLELVASLNTKQWMVFGAVLVYYGFVRWIHHMLEAGPIVLIVTALTLIFTIGLSDEEHRQGLSAYSVFNRGFQTLMGSVDANALLAQHVGGGLVALAPVGDEALYHNENEDGDHEILPEVAARRPQHQPNPPQDGNDGNIVGDEVNDEVNHNNINSNNRSRKSGKKARRRNLEQRRELQQQREAAMRLGLDDTGSREEMMAIQQLLEEQLAADNNRTNLE